MATFEEFKKLEFVIGQIKEVEEHPNADKLYLVKVDIGEEQRQLVAGIRPSYAKEDLVGKRIVMLKNIETATIRGEESQGMLLAASDENGMSIVMPDRDVALGSLVK